MASLSDITDLFKVFSDLTRLRMMRLLVITRSELCVGELMQSVQGQPYNISKQLKVLGHARMVTSRKVGRHVYYRLGLSEDPFVKLLIQLIKELPDEDGEFEADRVRFLEVLEQRGLQVVVKAGVGERSVERSPKKTLEAVALSDVVPATEDDGSDEDLPSYLL